MMVGQEVAALHDEQHGGDDEVVKVGLLFGRGDDEKRTRYKTFPIIFLPTSLLFL